MGEGYVWKRRLRKWIPFLTRTKEALMEFMGIITPIIENAKDDHERLFWHHIFEEEEHRSDRLDILMPKIQALLIDGADISSNQPRVCTSFTRYKLGEVWLT